MAKMRPSHPGRKPKAPPKPPTNNRKRSQASRGKSTLNAARDLEKFEKQRRKPFR